VLGRQRFGIERKRKGGMKPSGECIIFIDINGKWSRKTLMIVQIQLTLTMLRLFLEATSTIALQLCWTI
jgi:hypothetical protein